MAKVGGDTPVGKGVYTHFLDAKGGVRADLTLLRLGQDHYRVVDGADAGQKELASGVMPKSQNALMSVELQSLHFMLFLCGAG